MSKPDWERAGREANELTEVYSEPPIPVVEIAERQSVEVLFGSFGDLSNEVAGLCDFEKKQYM